MKCAIVIFTVLLQVAVSRDFYTGMFQRNDYLVASDTLYKERVPFRIQYAKYGRLFKCPITYIRVVDRLGYGRGPRTTIIRGGLRKKYVVMRLTAYNMPISVNVYVGCENKDKYTTTSKPTIATTAAANPDVADVRNDTGPANDSTNDNSPAPGDSTDVTGGTDSSDAGESTPDAGESTPDAAEDTSAATEAAANESETNSTEE